MGGIAVSHTNTVNQWSKWEFSRKIYIAGNKSIIFMYKTRLHSDSQLAMYIHSSYSEKRRQKKSMPESAEKPKPNKSWKNIFRGSLAQAFKRSSSVLIFFSGILRGETEDDGAADEPDSGRRELEWNSEFGTWNVPAFKNSLWARVERCVCC